MIENQAFLFLVFSITGVILGILFDFFRAIRKTFKTSDFWTCIKDVIYSLIAGIIILYNIYFFNNGEIRIFMIIGIIMGALIYTLTLSSIFIKINSFILQKAKFIINFISKIFKMPIKITIKIVKKLINCKNKKGNLKSNDE